MLLDYPDGGAGVPVLDELDGAASPATRTSRRCSRTCVDTDLEELQQDYVATFDHTRKCALYLTYFALRRHEAPRHGAGPVQGGLPRGRRRSGTRTGELPDHLCAVLQFGATVDAEAAWRLLDDHRAAVEMLRLALTGWRNDDGTTGSPWAAALLALCDTLPALKGDEATPSPARRAGSPGRAGRA